MIPHSHEECFEGEKNQKLLRAKFRSWFLVPAVGTNQTNQTLQSEIITQEGMRPCAGLLDPKVQFIFIRVNATVPCLDIVLKPA